MDTAVRELDPTIAAEPDVWVFGGPASKSVVGYVHSGALGVASLDEVDAMLARVAASSGLRMGGVYLDRSGGRSWRDQWMGRTAFLQLIRRRRLDGLLVLSVEHLGPEVDVREGFLRVLAGVGGVLYVADADAQIARPFPLPAAHRLRGGGTGHSPTDRPPPPDDDLVTG